MWKKTALICLLANSLILCIAGQNFKLPKTTAPLAYTVNINTNIEAILFDGVVTIDIKVLQPTREIILHNQHLDITKLSAYDHCSRSSFQIISNTTLEQSDLYVIGFRDEMTVNCVYELMILYNGRLRINNTGLFLAHYEDGDNFGVLALTNFEQARSIFPCYDEPEYKAIFTITIETSDHYHTISNMPIESEMHLENRMITQFEDTMLLSPNSLSFLITNLTFNCDADQTIFFYARQSELHTMDFSLETASRALAALKSYLDTNITLNEIKHVAVPSEDLLAKSFYGLITYRESLISFNAQSSPDLKKIQIAKMIAEKTAQQFFGHIVSDTGDENMWITKGLAKFLEYHGIMELDASFALEKLFVIEMLQPSLNLNLNDQDYEVGDEHLFDKVSCIFRMVNWAIGEEAFKKGLQTLFNEKKFSTISSLDLYSYLQDAYENEENVIIGDVIESWVNGNEIAPVLLITRNYENDNGEIRISRQNEAANSKQMWIPFNYLTENGVTSDIQWLQDIQGWKDLIISSLKSEEWILVNVEQFGLYRVNYDTRNWQLLINALKTNHTEISEVNRAQILDDAFYLAKMQLLSFETYLDLLEYLELEEDYLPWATAVKGLQELRTLLIGSEIEEYFKMFNQKLIKGLYLKIYQYGMSFMDLFMQSLAMNWACDIELPECLAETLNSMNSLMSSDFHIPANDHQKILCNGLKFGNDNDFEVLWRNLQSSKNLEERLNLIDALACYPKSQALKDYLESTLVNSVEAQYSRKECLEVIKAVISRSSLGFKVSLDFLMEFKEFNISRRYGQEINGIFEEISKKVITSEVLLEFNNLLDLYAEDLHPNTALKCNNIINNNIKWIDGDDYKILTNFLNARFDTDNISPESLFTTSEIEPSIDEGGAASRFIFSTALLALSVLITNLKF